MTKIFRMAIKIMNYDVQFDRAISISNFRIGKCGYEILDILTKCFGGCLRSKGSMLKIKDLKHIPKLIKISNYRANSL